MDAWKLIEAIEGPRLSIPVALVLKLGDLRDAAFLQQAVFLSALRRDAGGWFFLSQSGSPDERPTATLFQRLGSWQAALGLSADAQLSIRRRLKKMGLLEESLRGVPARLHYRADPEKYLAFISADTSAPASAIPGNQFPQNPESRFRDPKNQGSEKTASYRNKERKEEREEEKEKRERARGGRDAKFEVDQRGIHHKPLDERDRQAMAAIFKHPHEEVQEAVAQAAAIDDMGRAFPAAVLRILLRKAPPQGVGAPQVPRTTIGMDFSQKKYERQPI